MPYHHFAREEQDVISHMAIAGFSLREIGRRIGRHHTGISREIRRSRPTHADDAVYWYDAAEYYAKERRHRARHRRRQHQGLAAYVTSKVRLDWPLEAIAGRLRVDYPDDEAMRRFHGEGFGILGVFVFGFDYENKDVFEQTLEFTMRSRMDCVELRILTPFPGTRLYERLLKEGRLFVRDWWLRGYPPDALLFQPRGMTADELINGFARLNRQAYSFGAMTKRFFGMSPWKRTFLGCRVYAGLNLSTRKRYFKGLGNPQPFAGACGAMGKDELSPAKKR